MSRASSNGAPQPQEHGLRTSFVSFPNGRKYIVNRDQLLCLP